MIHKNYCISLLTVILNSTLAHLFSTQQPVGSRPDCIPTCKVCPWSDPHSFPPCEPGFNSPRDLLNKTHSFYIRTFRSTVQCSWNAPLSRVSPEASFSIFKSKLDCPSKSDPCLALITLSVGYFSLHFLSSILFSLSTLEHDVYFFHSSFICFCLPIFPTRTT